MKPDILVLSHKWIIYFIYLNSCYPYYFIYWWLLIHPDILTARPCTVKGPGDLLHFCAAPQWSLPCGFSAKSGTSVALGWYDSSELIWLVVWLPFLAFSQKYWVANHPLIDELIFFRGLQTTNQWWFWGSTDHPKAWSHSHRQGVRWVSGGSSSSMTLWYIPFFFLRARHLKQSWIPKHFGNVGMIDSFGNNDGCGIPNVPKHFINVLGIWLIVVWTWLQYDPVDIFQLPCPPIQRFADVPGWCFWVL